MLMRYAKDRSYYEDQYDLHTIEECLDWYWSIRKKFEANRKHKDFKNYSDKKFNQEVHKVCSYTVNVIKAERFRKRKDRIQEWMGWGQKTQDIFDNSQEPSDIVCSQCSSPVKLISKDLMNAYDDDAYVLFMFECVKCKKRRAVYEDGREWHSEPPKCPKCQGDLISDIKHRKKDILVFTYSCKKCGYKREDLEVFEKSRKETEAKEARDKKLLKEYREEFCYSEEDGLSAIQSLDGIKAFMDEIKATKKKEADPIYKKAMKLKKLKLNQLKDLLEKVIKDKGYGDLQFDKPEMGVNVVVGFTITDTDDSREERDSIYTLQRLIKTALLGTNWRLMSDGISYRLGILTGRLKAYETEEDLMKLVKTKKVPLKTV